MPGENSGSLNMHLVWGSVWERNCKDLHRKMKEIVPGENLDSLNIHLVWGSVWERNCKDLHRKMKDFRGGLCRGKIWIR